MTALTALTALAEQHHLRVIEDCAQAHGAEIAGRRVGTFGDCAAFSFYPGKNLGAYGDGGALVTNNADLGKRARMIANHGRIGKYDHEFEGRNSRLDGLQAAILSAKLPHLDGWLERRRAVAATYRSGLADLDSLVLPEERANCRHVYHLFVVRVNDRDSFRERLSEAGIATGVHYPTALPDLPAYSHHDANTPQSSNWSTDLVSLPMGEHLSDDQVQFIINEVHKLVADY